MLQGEKQKKVKKSKDNSRRHTAALNQENLPVNLLFYNQSLANQLCLGNQSK